MNSESKHLNLGNSWIEITNTSEIRDCNGVTVESIVKDSIHYVELDWYNGRQLYEKGLVILAAFDRIQYSTSLYDEVEVIYIDGDKDNCFLSNLTYVFKKPIESTRLTGFYLIPGAPNYVINKLGTVYNVFKNNFCKWWIYKGDDRKNKRPGYLYTSMIVCGHPKSCYQHRLLCLVFKKIKTIFKDTIVNHKNGIKSDNDLDNLEWATYSNNSKHAWDTGLVKGWHSAILMRNLLTKEIIRFSSMRECSRYLGDNGSYYVSQRIKDQSSTIYPDYLQFKMDDDSEWSGVDWSEIPNSDSSLNLNVAARNVFTGVISIFNTAKECSEATGVSARVILYHCRGNKVLPRNEHNFRFLVNAKQWPRHTQRCLEIYKTTPNEDVFGIIVNDSETGEEKFYPSIRACTEGMGFNSVNSTMNYVDHPYRKYKKRFSFKSYNPTAYITVS